MRVKWRFALVILTMIMAMMLSGCLPTTPGADENQTSVVITKWTQDNYTWNLGDKSVRGNGNGNNGQSNGVGNNGTPGCGGGCDNHPCDCDECPECPTCDECPECNCNCECICGDCVCDNGDLVIYYTIKNDDIVDIDILTISFNLHAADGCEVVVFTVVVEELCLKIGETRKSSAKFEVDDLIVWVELKSLDLE